MNLFRTGCCCAIHQWQAPLLMNFQKKNVGVQKVFLQIVVEDGMDLLCRLTTVSVGIEMQGYLTHSGIFSPFRVAISISHLPVRTINSWELRGYCSCCTCWHNCLEKQYFLKGVRRTLECAHLYNCTLNTVKAVNLKDAGRHKGGCRMEVGVTAFTLCPNVHSYEAMAPMNNSASVADDYVLII